MTDQAITVHDFDVLADELPGDVYDMDDYKNQIGNNRFDVLIHMYQDGFNKNYAKNNEAECEDIVQKIVDVTCHKSSSSLHNQGRFLVKPLYSINEWRQLSDEQAKQFVRQALRATTIQEEEIPDQGEQEDDVFAPLPVTSKIDLGKMNIPSIDFGNMELNDDSKKRGRRRSLLRRSASESTMLMDKKKGLKNLAGELYRAAAGNSPPPPNSALRRYHSVDLPETLPLPAQEALQRFHSESVLPPHSQRSFSDTEAVGHACEKSNSNASMAGTIVHTVDGMDVVLSEDCTTFSTKPDIIGNNRLRVSLTLEERTFATLTPREQNDAACNLVKAVTEYWGGRILADKGFAYEILSHDQCVQAMKNLLSASSPTPPIAKVSTVDEVTSSVKSTASTASSKTSASTQLLAAAPPVPEFLRNASREILNSGKGGVTLAGPEKMQSAAVRSIKERADKRKEAKAKAKGSAGGKGTSGSTSTTSSETGSEAEAAVNVKKEEQ